jgi:hypothetical protein
MPDRRFIGALTVAALLLAGSLRAAPTSAPDISAPEVREVVAEGRAAIGAGGLLGARRAATAQALRTAVEKTTGVFVSARTLTHNYELVRDQIVTHADGFATLKEVLRESDGPQEVSVTVRALVSLRPLAQQLKSLGLTRAWRVFIAGENPDGGAPGPPAELAVTALEKTLADAGFVVVSSARNADVLVRVRLRFTTVADTPLDTAAGPMTLHSVRGELTVRATRAGTGEVAVALSGAGNGLHIALESARATATDQALTTLGPGIAEALLLLPARDSQPVELVVSPVGSAAAASRLEEALNALSGIRGVIRRSFAGGRAVYELDVLSLTQSELGRELEEAPALRAFRLTVTSDTASKIVAIAAATSPNRHPH